MDIFSELEEVESGQEETVVSVGQLTASIKSLLEGEIG